MLDANGWQYEIKHEEEYDDDDESTKAGLSAVMVSVLLDRYIAAHGGMCAPVGQDEPFEEKTGTGRTKRNTFFFGSYSTGPKDVSHLREKLE